MQLYSVALLVEFGSKKCAAPFKAKAQAANYDGGTLLKAVTILAANPEQAIAIAASFVEPNVCCTAHATEIPRRAIVDFLDATETKKELFYVDCCNEQFWIMASNLFDAEDMARSLAGHTDINESYSWQGHMATQHCTNTADAEQWVRSAREKIYS
jgi:hypothetical protein